ncbi:MAG: DUF2794 domain-containing protein [Rhizomicrobium sp.]
MAEEPIAFVRAGHAPAARTGYQGGQGRAPAASGATLAQVRFDRAELNRILVLYGRMVAAGEWRDYAIDFRDEVAVFSIYRRTSEMPLFRVEKRPKLREKQGMYAVIAATGHILKRGHDLAAVLRVFDKKLIKALASE